MPGPTHGPGTKLITQTFQLSAIDAHWLPAAYRPIHIDLPGSQVLPGSTSLFLEQALRGVTYQVQSEISNPDKTILESVSFADLGAMHDDVALPQNFSSDAADLARRVTANAVTPYDKALALMRFFQSGPFVYDQSVDLGANAHALDEFLFKTHRGFCEQYSAAFAELARSIGLPTRVAVGYQRGTLGADGRWHVVEKDAHAWPEVWLGSTIGWYRFEPTPGRVDPITGLGRAVTGPSGPTTTTPSTTPRSTTPTTAGGTPTSLPKSIQTIQPPTAQAAVGHTRTRGDGDPDRDRRRGRRVARVPRVPRVRGVVAHPPAPARSGRPATRASARGPKRSNGSRPRASCAGPRRPRSSSHCAKRPRSARAPPVRRSWISRACTPPRCTRPIPRRPRTATPRGRRSTRSRAAMRSDRAADAPVAGPMVDRICGAPGPSPTEDDDESEDSGDDGFSPER